MAVKKKKKKAMTPREKKLLAKVEVLSSALAEARETLRAIQSGEVDALVINDDKGERIFTLKNADQPYRILVETMNEGAATLRKDGMIFYGNQRFSEFLQIPLEKLIGTSFYDFISEDEQLTFRDLVEGENKRRGNKVFTIKTGEGQRILTQISMSPAEIEDGPGVCIITTDLTEQKMTADELRKSRDLLESRVGERTIELAKSVKVRDDFLSIASHELKTPLTSLKLQAQMRKRRLSLGDYAYFESGKLKKMVEDDERQINRLNRLVDDMLDISRLHTGKLSLHLEEVDLRAIIKEVIERFSPQLQASGIELSFKDGEPVLGNWDRYRMEQIFTNLLTNAIKYGSNNPISVTLEADEENARVTVQDRGIGIAKQDQRRIFKQFERAISSREVSGLGLGLYIVKQLVDAHNGRIWVDSAVGEGSKFSFEIPLKSDPAEEKNVGMEAVR